MFFDSPPWALSQCFHSNRSFLPLRQLRPNPHLQAGRSPISDCIVPNVMVMSLAPSARFGKEQGPRKTLWGVD